MIRVMVYDSGGSIELGTFESVQMTGIELRDPDGKTILRFDTKTKVWFDLILGNGWYDWTVEAA